MPAQIRTTDAKGRVSLPRGFANATVLVEQVSATEVRVRKAKVVPEDRVRFLEEDRTALSDRDRDLFLALLAKPPKPNAVLKRAIAKYRARHG